MPTLTIHVSDDTLLRLNIYTLAEQPSHSPASIAAAAVEAAARRAVPYTGGEPALLVHRTALKQISAQIEDG